MGDTAATPDLLVVGAGAIGLSIAYRAAAEGLAVTLVDRGEPGREASWAGAGVLPPRSWYVPSPVLDRLAAFADGAHEEWSRVLRDETGIDDGYRRCGAIYLDDDANREALRSTFRRWRAAGVTVDRDQQRRRWLVPSEAQVRNPRRLRAMVAGCERRGVRVVSGVESRGFAFEGSRIVGVETSAGRFAASEVCLAAGCWTPALAELAGATAPGRPIRGQLLLLRTDATPLERIVHRPPYYLVPRGDGLVLVGATVEDVGFARGTTETARAELLAAAIAIEPRLALATAEGFWSGLRPQSGDALPLVGRAPGIDNLWIASGHHRSGWQFAPATAELIVALLLGRPTDLPSAELDPGRFAACFAA
ncbi:MAG: NAD(P)/FAD-dependent oxidoreductase [Lacipirellulaceae bacterium]